MWKRRGGKLLVRRAEIQLVLGGRGMSRRRRW